MIKKGIEILIGIVLCFSTMSMPFQEKKDIVQDLTLQTTTNWKDAAAYFSGAAIGGVVSSLLIKNVQGSLLSAETVTKSAMKKEGLMEGIFWAIGQGLIIAALKYSWKDKLYISQGILPLLHVLEVMARKEKGFYILKACLSVLIPLGGLAAVHGKNETFGKSF